MGARERCQGANFREGQNSTQNVVIFHLLSMKWLSNAMYINKVSYAWLKIKNMSQLESPE